MPRAGRSLRLTFSEPLDEAHAPPSVAFVVTVDDNGTVTDVAVTSVVVSAETVTLSLASPVLPGQVVTVDYTVPSSAWPALQDPAGNEVVSFADEAVDNQAGRRRPPPPPVTGGGGGAGAAGVRPARRTYTVTVPPRPLVLTLGHRDPRRHLSGCRRGLFYGHRPRPGPPLCGHDRRRTTPRHALARRGGPGVRSHGR